MPINDQDVLAFSNEQVRHTAEILRNLQPQLTTFVADWQSVSAEVPNDATVVPDNNQSTQPYTGANMTGIVTLVIAVLAQLDAPNVMDNVNPATVQPLQLL